MANKDRQYARQTLERCQKHIETIQENLMVVANAFTDVGNGYYGNFDNFPDEYKGIIIAAQIYIDMSEEVGKGIKAMYDSI